MADAQKTVIEALQAGVTSGGSDTLPDKGPNDDDDEKPKKAKSSKKEDAQDPDDANDDDNELEKQIETKTKSSGDHLSITADVTLDLQAQFSPEDMARGSGAENADVDKGVGSAPKLARFSMVAATGIPMKLRGWKFPVILNMEGGTVPSQVMPMRMNHDHDQGVGHSDAISIQGGQLHAIGVISRGTPAATDVIQSARNGFPWKASLGADPDSKEDVEFIRAGESVNVNGRDYNGPLNVVHRWTLGEISFVDRGADGGTSVEVAAMAKDGNDSTNDQDVGQSGITADQTDAMMRLFDERASERQRIQEIAALGDKYTQIKGCNIETIRAIAKKAASDKSLDKRDVELLMLKASRQEGPSINRVEIEGPRVIEAALCLHCGIDDNVLAKDRDYGDAVVSGAYRFRRRGLNDTLKACLQAMGVNPPHGKDELLGSIVENQHRRMSIEAEGFSTINLPGILGNVANKLLLNAFLNVEVIYDKVADQADLTNFHTHNIFRLESTGEFQKVGGDGELKHGSLSQDYYQNKLDTYGMLLAITRQDVINDDLNAFRTYTAQIARKARIAADKLMVTIMMESSDSFYTAAKGNRLTGNALSVAGLGDAEAALLMMTDQSGDPIYAVPDRLIVPPNLKYLADQFFRSENVGITTTTQLPTENIFRGRFQVIESPFFQLSTIPGYSSTTWYLMANPLSVASFQMAYLEGRRAPTVQTADALFNYLGMQMRVFWDIGVAQLDGRGTVKSTA